METSNIQSLSEEQLSCGQNLNNSFISTKTNFIFHNEIDSSFLLTLKENKFSEEFKKIIHAKDLESDSLDNDFSKENNLLKTQQFFQNDNESTIKTSNNNISSSTPEGSSPDIINNIFFKVSYFNFLIRLANDAIKTVFGKKSKFYFKDIKYKLKKIVRHNYVEKLKLSKYSDIVQMKVSPKNRSHEENFNKETYMEICKISPELKKFFDINYLYIFQKYFCRIKTNQNIINFEGLEIKLSPHTKGLFNLLRKNWEQKEKFNEIIKNVYFCNSKFAIDNPFISSNPFIISH